MNQIDKKFYHLINYLRDLSTDEIFDHIKAFFHQIPSQIQKNIEDYFQKFPYWGELNIQENNYDQLYQKAKSLSNHLEEYIWLYEHLSDYRSKKLLYAILNNWYQYDFNTLNQCIEHTYPDYFDPDIIPFSSNEVLVDLGAYIGDSTLDFIKMYNKQYQKIYCYEVTPETCEKLKNNLSNYQNIEIRQKAASDSNKILYLNPSTVDASANQTTAKGTIKVEAVSLDEDIKEKITMIKMDIESAEQAALKGSENHIINENPKLLISVYHNNEDLWKIPRMINEMNPNYKFYLRYHGGSIYPTEITLLAIPTYY